MVIKQKSNGFTLIEAMIATFILVIVVGAAVSVEVQNVRSTTHNKYRLEALGLAQEGINAVETVRNENLLNEVAATEGLLSGTYYFDETTSRLKKTCGLVDESDPNYKTQCIDPIPAKIINGKEFKRRIVIP